jgi:selenocysteine lyase/cysteine desulfurase
VRDCFADFVVADGHKWMLGPEGLAVFYSRPEIREQLNLLQYGWHMVKHAGDFDRLDWGASETARRFEAGSPNMLGIQALDASLSLFEDVGMEHVEAVVLANSAELIDWILDQAELELVTPVLAGRHAGIVTFKHKKLDVKGHASLYRALMKAGVICANRAGGIRLSPHFYSDVSGFAPIWQRLIREFI